MLDMLNADLLLVPQVCELELEILLSSSIHRLRLGEEIIREYDDSVKETAGAGFQELNDVARKTAAFSKYIHAVILVLKANDPRLQDGVYSGTLQKITEYFRTHGNNDINHKDYNFLDCAWFVIGQFKTQSYSKLYFNQSFTFKVVIYNHLQYNALEPMQRI